ncbi:helix-turn-helix transcriptional regulator [Pseudomonas aeruginosa]|nr:helix-turn-helix transcriptional regulator [Pseudomonas aeruginosa]
MLIDLPSTRPVFAYAQDYLHGERVELHRHSRAQLIHALSGVVTGGTAEGTWGVPPGRGVWLPAGIEHALRFAGQVRMRTLFIAPQARHDLPQDCRVVDVPPLLRQLIVAAMRIAPDYPPGGRDERVMELILDELRVLPILALHVPQPVDPRLAALCRSLRAEPAADWSLGDAARRLGVSPRTLTRAFQRETGLSFVQWLRRMRLLASLDALAAGHSILEVALDLGYDSQSAFSAMFRRTLGVSPSLYFGRGAAYGVAEGD